MLPISMAIKTLRGEMPNRAGRWSITKETAAQWLRSVSGEDFGQDALRWGEWLRRTDGHTIAHHSKNNLPTN
jgi:hypothetical protein